MKQVDHGVNHLIRALNRLASELRDGGELERTDNRVSSSFSLTRRTGSVGQKHPAQSGFSTGLPLGVTRDHGIIRPPKSFIK
jgi:hypothetical protein